MAITKGVTGRSLKFLRAIDKEWDKIVSDQKFQKYWQIDCHKSSYIDRVPERAARDKFDLLSQRFSLPNFANNTYRMKLSPFQLKNLNKLEHRQKNELRLKKLKDKCMELELIYKQLLRNIPHLNRPSKKLRDILLKIENNLSYVFDKLSDPNIAQNLDEIYSLEYTGEDIVNDCNEADKILDEDLKKENKMALTPDNTILPEADEAAIKNELFVNPPDLELQPQPGEADLQDELNPKVNFKENLDTAKKNEYDDDLSIKEKQNPSLDMKPKFIPEQDRSVSEELSEKDKLSKSKFEKKLKPQNEKQKFMDLPQAEKLKVLDIRRRKEGTNMIQDKYMSYVESALSSMSDENKAPGTYQQNYDTTHKPVMTSILQRNRQNRNRLVDALDWAESVITNVPDKNPDDEPKINPNNPFYIDKRQGIRVPKLKKDEGDNG